MENIEIKKPLKVNFKGKYIPNEEDKQYQAELDKLTDKTFADAGNTRTIKNIRETLIWALKKKYGKTNGELKAITDGLLKIHGLHEDNFDYINLFSKYISKNINDLSIDANANKSEKSIKGVLKDLELSTDKLIGYDFLYRTMKELYGQDEAKRLAGDMYDFSLGLADSSNILIPYCWAIDASKLITIGRDFGVLPSKPAKRLSSYISSLCETIHQLASHLAGAVAIGSFFTDCAHILIYKERISLKDIKENKQVRKRIENEFQQFVHSVNFLSRNGNESPFTNISIFDKEKLDTFLSADNYGWLFPNKVEVRVDNNLGDEDYKLSNEEYKEFVKDYVFELQKIFIDFFDKGDPMNGGINYRFPVCFPKTESVLINGKLTTFGEEFSEYEDGWTEVNNLYTIYKNKPVKINKVFKGKASEFIKFDSSYGFPIIVTPDHKLQLSTGELKKAKDINIGDRLNLFFDQITDYYKDYLLVSDYLTGLQVLGYKVKYTENTKNLFKWSSNHKCPHSLHSNFTKSHSLDSIRKCYPEDILEYPEVEYVKTKESKHKGAIINKIKLDNDFGRFLGLYYAEGHNSNGELAFSLNKNETEYISFLENYLKSVLGIKHVKIQFNELYPNGVQVCFYSKTLGLLLDQLIGKYCYYKKINSNLYDSPLSFREGLLRGIIEGDGNINEYTISLTTTSKEGAISINYLAQTLGIRSNLIFQKPMLCTLNNKIGHEQYIVNFKKYDILNHNYNLGKTDNLKLTKSLNTEGYLIKSKLEYNVDQPEDIYNIEVDNQEHLFQLPNGIITSNCTVNFSKHKNEETGKDELNKDNELLEYMLKKDISKYNVFTSYGTKIASCCRMINNTELMDMAASVNSFGGSNVSLGSHRVVTTNFARIAYEADNYDEYLEILKDRVYSSAKILKAHRVLITKLNELGLEPFIKNGWINMNRMFSTYGVLGIVEADQIIKQKFGNKDFDYMGDILIKFNNLCKEASAENGIIFNIEQIPAESFAVRLADADKLIYGNPYNLDCLYANQFCALWKKAGIYERLEIDGKYNQLLSGGGIVHAQANSKVTSNQARNIILHAVECGCEHFAINVVYTQCTECHNVVVGMTDICPKCGGKHFDHYSRVIGFFTKVEDWNPTRRDWEFQRRQFIDLKQADKK